MYQDSICLSGAGQREADIKLRPYLGTRGQVQAVGQPGLHINHVKNNTINIVNVLQIWVPGNSSCERMYM